MSFFNFDPATDPTWVPVLAAAGSLTNLYDFGLNGQGYMIAWEIDRELLSPWKVAYEMDAVDELIPRRDDATGQMAENKMDTFWWMVNRDWTYGAGQIRYDQTNNSYPGERAFYDSQGIDVMSAPGQAQLLPQVSNVQALTNSIAGGDPQFIVATNTQVFVAEAPPNVGVFSNLDASDFVSSATATTTNQPIYAMATDGQNAYLALGPDGITDTSGATLTTRDQLNTSVGWGPSSVAITLSTDTSILAPGSSAVVEAAVTSGQSGPVNIQKNESLNLLTAHEISVYLREDLPLLVTHNASSSQVSAPSGTNESFAFPSGATAGQTLVVSATATDGSYTIISTGYTLLASSTFSFLAYKTLTSADISAGNFVMDQVSGTTATIAVAMILLSSPSGGQIVSAGGSAGTLNSNNSGSFTSLYPDAILFESPSAFLGTAGTWATPAGFTLATQTNTSSQATLGLFYQQFPTVGPTGTTNFSYSGTLGGDNQVLSGALAVVPPVSQPITIQLQTTSTDYYTFTYTPAVVGVWYQPIIQFSQFTVVGNPTWANITKLEFTFPATTTVGLNYRFSQLASGSGATFSSLTTADSRMIGWAKDRLYAAGINSGSTWKFFEVDLTGGNNNKTWLVLPTPNYTVSAISELGGFVYFSSVLPSRSQIYAFDGTTVPFIAVQIPGEQVTMMQPFLGAGLLIGTRRSGTKSPSVGQGVLYRAFPDSSGHLTLEQIALFGVDDGNDYAPLCGAAFQNWAFFGYPRCAPETFQPPGLAPANAATTSGLGIYNPATGGFARHLEATSVAQTVGVTVYRNRKIFTVDGLGVFVEQSKYVSQGQLISSVFDWNIDTNKIALLGDIGTLPLPTGTTAELDVSTDNGSTWQQVAVNATTGTTDLRGQIVENIQIAQYRVILKSNGAFTSTPVLKKAGISAIYGEKPSRVWKIAVKAYNRMTMRNGSEFPGSGPELAANIEATLLALHNSQSIVAYQPPGWNEESNQVVPVRVASLRVLRQFQPEAGWANIIQCELAEVPLT